MYRIILIFLGFISFQSQGVELTSKQKDLLNMEIEAGRKLASDPALVAIVEKYNKEKPEKNAQMSEDAWKALTNRDFLIIDLKSNEASKILQMRKTQQMSEMFLSGADGTKIAFLSKTSSWSHKGSPKHEDPMKGLVWTGTPEFDKSSATYQIQFSLPVLKGDKSIGSLVIGVGLLKGNR